MKKDDGCIISENQLELRDQIGQGRFGIVRLGIMNQDQIVAVKIMKDVSSLVGGYNIATWSQHISHLKQVLYLFNAIALRFIRIKIYTYLLSQSLLATMGLCNSSY